MANGEKQAQTPRKADSGSFSIWKVWQWDCWELSWGIWRGMNSKQNENKTHTNPLISLVLPGNFNFFQSHLFAFFSSWLSPHQYFSSQNATLNVFYKVRFPTTAVTIFEILESVAPQCLVFIFVSHKTGHDVNGSLQIFDLQITAWYSYIRLPLDGSKFVSGRILDAFQDWGRRSSLVFLPTVLIHPLLHSGMALTSWWIF